MLENGRQIVKEVVQDEVSSLKAEVQTAIAPIRAELDACVTQLEANEEVLSSLTTRVRRG